MSVDDLCKLVRPPSHPIEPGTIGEWEEVQKSAGCILPIDIRDIGIRYGSGRFRDGFLSVFNPFSQSYRECMESQYDTLKTAKEWGLEYDVFPKTPGLFPWGRDENGNMFCWLTEGKPDEWPAIVYPRSVGEIARWDMPLSTFLVKLFLNEIKLSAYHERVKKKELKFIPRPQV